jgi:hypothetical protein
MEKMVNKRLIYVPDERNLLPEQQYKINRSTTDVLNILNIIEALRKKEYLAMLSLDISRAYDTC